MGLEGERKRVRQMGILSGGDAQGLELLRKSN